MSLEIVFDYREPPFKAESREAMVYTILAFCKGKDASVLYDFASEETVRFYVDEKASEKVASCFNKAAGYCTQEKYEGAKNTIYKILKIWPFHSESYRMLAQILFLKGELDKAIDTNLEALRFDKKNLNALILMGNVLSAKGNLQGADNYFSKVLEYHPNDALALNNLGGIYCKRKEYKQGEIYLKKALEIDPTALSAYYGLSLARYNQGFLQEAFDWAHKGLLQGAEYVGDGKYIPIIAGHAFDVAVRLEEETDFLSMAMDVAKGIEEKYNTTIKFVEDDSMTVLAHIEFADQHKRNYHVLKYRPNGHFAHLVLHELMHLVMMLDALAVGRLKTIGSDQRNFDLFMERNSKVFDAVRRDFGVVHADGLAEQMFKGLSVQVLSVPLDLFVEKRIYDEFPQFRAAQYASLYQMELDNIKAVKEAANVQYFPQKVKDVNLLLNMVTSLGVHSLYGTRRVFNFSGESRFLDDTLQLYFDFQRVLETYQPGDEYDLFETYAKYTDMLDYFRISTTASGPEPSFKTETELNQEKFDKTHGKGDPIEDAMMCEYMLNAMRNFAAMLPEDVAAVARECAITGMNGVKTDGSTSYKLSAFPEKRFSGYEFLAWFYVSWAEAFPDMLQETGLPFHHAYEMARNIFDKEV